MTHRSRRADALESSRNGRRSWRTDGLAVSIADYAPNRIMPAHAHDTLGVSVVLRGSVEETSGRTSERAGVASAVIKPPGTIHANRFGPNGARLLAVEIDEDRAAGLLDHQGTLARWRWVRVLHTLGVASRVMLELSAAAQASDGALENVAIDLVAALDDDVQRWSATRAPSWLERIRERLEDEYGQPCRVRELALEAGVHPVYLARRFRRQFGTSVLGYLRAVRLREAVRELADADRPLADIAYHTGFSDQSHLTRVLRAATGLTPLEYRLLARSA
jgi:AraC family transcriptional regulator